MNQQQAASRLANEIPKHLLPAFRLLLRAHDYASSSASDVWEFAVELAVLCENVDRTDLRWLVKKDLLIHGRELTKPTDAKRRFAENAPVKFGKRSCFILSDSGVGIARAIGASHGGFSECLRPRWDESRHQLWLGDALVKQFKVPSRNQEAILAAFEEEDWPARIFDPLTPLPEIDPKRRLHDTIKGLNRNQKQEVMRFHGDGTGEAVIWEPLGHGENGENAPQGMSR